MRSWLRKLRGILGTGAVWGFAGTVFGSAVGAVSTLLGGSLVSSTIMGGLWFGASGFVLGSSFAVILTALHGRKTLDELTPRKAGFWGGLVGMSIPVLGNVTTILMVEAPLVQLVPSILVNAVLYGALAGSLAAGTVIAAKRAPELSSGSGLDPRALAEASGERN